jgi:hypothetical protein
MMTVFGLTLFVSLALLSYRLLLETMLPLYDQSALWTAGCSAMTIAVVAFTAVAHFTSTAAPKSSRAWSVPRYPASSHARLPILGLRWIALGAVPASLTFGVTTYISTNVAAVPLLWLVPPGLYVATLIVAFSPARERVQPVVDRLLPLAVLPLVLLLVTQTTQPAFVVMSLHVLGFLVLTLVCHLELAASQRRAGHLTEFCLWLSVGALLGALFNTILAPMLFVSIAEYPIAIVAACLLRVTRQGHGTSVSRGLVTVVAVGALTLAAGVLAQQWSLDSQAWMAMLGVALVVSFSISRHAKYFAAAIAVMLVAGMVAGPSTGNGLYAERTFFGIYR